MQINTVDQMKTKRVLIIDDSTDMLGLLKCLLESKGYGIECRTNGEDALAQLRSGEPLPDVILLDLQMPVMDGYEFLRRRGECAELSTIPTIVISGEENFASDQDCSHPDLILTKPLSIASVIDALSRYPVT